MPGEGLDFAIGVKAKGDGLEQTSGALKKLEQGLSEDYRAVTKLEQAMKRLSKGGAVKLEDAEQYKNLAATHDLATARIKEREKSYAKLVAAAGKSGEVEKAAGKDASAALNEAGAALGKAGQMSAGAAIGWAALAVGIYKVAQAAAKAVIAFVDWSFGLSEAAKETQFLLSGMLESESAGSAMYATLRKIQGATGLETKSLTDMVKQLRAAKLEGPKLEAALAGLALRQAATGESGVAKLVEDLKAGKTTASKFNEEMRKVYGGMVAKHQLGLVQQFDEAKRKLGDIFAGVDLGPLEQAAKRFMANLDRPEVVAAIQKALGWVVEKLALAVDWATKWVSSITSDDLDAGLVSVKETIDSIATGLSAAVTIGSAFVSVGQAMAAPFVFVYDTIIQCVEALKQLDAAAGGSGTKTAPKMTVLDIPGSPSWVAKKLMGSESAANDGGSKAGAALDAGTAMGIDSGGLAEAAAARLGSRTLASLQASLDAHSPSKKAAYWGRMIGEGVAGGQDASRERVQAATNRLVQPPGGGGTGPAAGGASIVVGDIIITGVKDAASMAPSLRAELVRILQGLTPARAA